MTVHPFIEAEKRAGHSVKRACELMKVSRAAFYARRSGLPGPRGGAGCRADRTDHRGPCPIARDLRSPARACRAHTRGRWVWPASCRTTDAGRGVAGPAPPTTAGDHGPRSHGCLAPRPHCLGLPARPHRARHPLVRRHHIHPDRRGLALSGHGHRHRLPARGRLGNRRSPADRSGGRRTGICLPAASPHPSRDLPLGSRLPRRIQAVVATPRDQRGVGWFVVSRQPIGRCARS